MKNTHVARGFSRAFSFAIAVAVVPIALMAQTAQTAGVESKVDAVFAKWTSSTPGCAVGVATGGKPVLAKGYGMADLEHDVRISAETIFEGGSVSKQFTAAAVMLYDPRPHPGARPRHRQPPARPEFHTGDALVLVTARSSRAFPISACRSRCSAIRPTRRRHSTRTPWRTRISAIA